MFSNPLLNVAQRFAHRRTVHDVRAAHSLAFHRVLLGAHQNDGRHLVQHQVRRNAIVHRLGHALVEHTVAGHEHAIPHVRE